MNETIKNMAMLFFKKYDFLRYVLASLAVLLLSSANISYSSFVEKSMVSKIEFFKPVIDKLLKQGVDSTFLFDLIQNPEVKFDEKFVKINITGYLNKADYSQFYNPNSIKATRAFISENYGVLTEAEAKYGVPKEAIASILWVETRHGKFLGKSNIVNVFLSTAMSSDSNFIALNKRALRENSDIDPATYPELDKKILLRAEKKSKWALNEIIALEKMNKVSPISIYSIRGSWAGAFGMSQFLPSSYISWAVDGDNDGKVNLFDLNDAIYSVANYLKSNGWGNDDNSHKAAVYHYNNSNDYVYAVLKLTEKAKYQKLSKPLQQQIEELDYHGE